MKQKYENCTVRILIISAILFVIILMTANTVYALGVTPGRIVINFEPNFKKTITLSILNNEHKDFKAAVFVRGNLTNYITLDERTIEFKSSDESKTISYTIKLPAAIAEPGLQKTDIVIREIGTTNPGNEVNLGYLVSVVSQLYVKVPYTGKYAEISLDITEAKLGEDVNFFIPVFNLGEEDITAKARISIFDGEEEIAKIESNEKTVKIKERQELKAVWKSTVAGVLKAVAVVEYDSKIATAEKDFFVEEQFLLQPIDLSVEKFKLGEIAKFNILVRNIGSRKVYGAYSQIVLNDKNKNVVANSKSSAIDIEPLSEEVMISYWDTANVKEGVYEGKVAINYEDKSAEKAIKTTVAKDSIKVEIIGITAYAVAAAEEKNKLSILWAIIIVLVVANIAWFIYFKRKSKKR